MPRIAYIDWTPRTRSAAIIGNAIRIIEEYRDAGYVLTLRQLYYQFVRRNLIPNEEKEYKNLGAVITKARNAGYIDWHAIEDRGRGYVSPYIEESDERLISRLKHSINFDHWARQEYYVEVWVEKEALGNVIARACDPFDVPYLACKGYLSASEAWRAGQRLHERQVQGQQPVVIHLGDHDPSGIDMTRDNKERLDLYDAYGVEVRRIALNMDQVVEHGPPPNPAKITDTRFRDYMALYGRESWELDALEPSVIEELIRDEIMSMIDPDTLAECEQEEKEMIALFKNLEANWTDIRETLR